MPIQVDRDAQRAHVTELAARVVAAEGVTALTFRRVAELAGTSTAIVSTYFTDKRDLLLSTLRATATRTSVRFEKAIADGAGVQQCLEAWLPMDAERLDDWRVIIAFWGVAVSDPELAAVQDGHVGRARGRVERLLTGPGRAQTAHHLVSLMLGIALQAVFDPATNSARRQRRLLADGLARLAPQV
ncbi:TetR/AcrR family transcriptional regulator [Jatrophihabitans fulvus]